MSRLAAKHFLPGESDDIELRPIESLGKGGGSCIADRQALAVGGDPIAIGDTHARRRSIPGENDIIVEIDGLEIDNLAIACFQGADVFQFQLIDDIGHPAFAKGFPGEHIDAALAEQRSKGHFDCTGIRAGNDADAITGGDLQKLTGEVDAELQPGLGSLGPVRATERCILEVLDLPARALCARSRREIRARRPRQGSRHIHDNHPFRWRLSCGKGIPLEGCGRRSARQAEDPAASAWPIASNLLAVLLRSSILPFTIESLA